MEEAKTKSAWIKIEDGLPPQGLVVWIRRTRNRVEDAPIYIGRRNGEPLSKNPDASRNCHWNGAHVSTAFHNPEEVSNAFGMTFTSSFSDVTVEAWKRIEPPTI
jgi:hypothetical protein